VAFLHLFHGGAPAQISHNQFTAVYRGKVTGGPGACGALFSCYD